MHQNFFANHVRGETTQNVHAHGCLDVAEKQLDIPPLEIEFGQFLCRISRGIELSGDNVKPPGSEPGIRHLDLDLTQSQLFRKICPGVFGIRQKLGVFRTFPCNQQIIRPKLFEAAGGSNRGPSSEGDDTVNAPVLQICNIEITTEAFVTEEDVSWLERFPHC